MCISYNQKMLEHWLESGGRHIVEPLQNCRFHTEKRKCWSSSLEFESAEKSLSLLLHHCTSTIYVIHEAYATSFHLLLPAKFCIKWYILGFKFKADLKYWLAFYVNFLPEQRRLLSGSESSDPLEVERPNSNISNQEYLDQNWWTKKRMLIILWWEQFV